MGLLDFDSPDTRLGLGLLAAASARSDGAGFGQRLAEAVGSVDQWRQQQQMQKAREMQIQYQQALMADHQQKLIAEQRANEIAARKQAALPTIFSTGSAGAPAINIDAALPPEMRTGVGVQPAIAPRSSGVDVQRALLAGYSPKEIEELDKLRNVGLDEVARTIKGMQGGKEVEQQFDKFGRKIGAGFEQYRAPIEVSTGARKDLLDPYSLSPKASFAMEQSPDSKASNAVAWANNAISRERLAWDKGGGDSGESQAALNKQFGKPQSGYRWKADGSMEFIPGGPADQKAQLQKVGEGTVGGLVADLRDKYQRLDAEGGITTTTNRGLSNVGAYVGASDIGQKVGGLFGTKAQSARDAIAMTRPLLLQAIMKATGMSAKQMDSNAELKMYLATATDPQKGLEANMEALNRIEQLYGGGEKPTAKTLQDLPIANTSNKGMKVRDTVTGKVLVSDGMQWKEQ